MCSILVLSESNVTGGVLGNCVYHLLHQGASIHTWQLVSISLKPNTLDPSCIMLLSQNTAVIDTNQLYRYLDNWFFNAQSTTKVISAKLSEFALFIRKHTSLHANTLKTQHKNSSALLLPCAISKCRPQFSVA